jgi:hypothetical protein
VWWRKGKVVAVSVPFEVTLSVMLEERTKLRVRSFPRVSFWFLTNPVVVNRVIKEKDRLARQREEAEEALEEAMSRLRRIRKQERFLREKAAEMVARGVESLDELEEEERKEVEAAATEFPLGDPLTIDWGTLGFPEGFNLDPAFSGRTASAAAGSSSNA